MQCGLCPTCAEGKTHHQILQRSAPSLLSHWILELICLPPSWSRISCTDHAVPILNCPLVCVILSGVSLSQRFVQAAVQQWSRCAGRCVLGSLLPVWRPQWKDPDGHRLRGLPQARWAAHVRHWHTLWLLLFFAHLLNLNENCSLNARADCAVTSFECST